MGKNETTAAFGNRTILAGCVAAILGFTSPTVFATVFVNNCNDAGAGSLRSAVAGAPTGETVDLTGLDGVCSTITLKTGAITVNQANLTFVGPGSDKLAISAKYNSNQYNNRIFTHNGSGSLYLQDMTITKGYVPASPARGGCIYSNGSVTLKDATVSFCTAKDTTGFHGAFGGGVFAKGSLTMKESTLKYATASGGNGTGGDGGAYCNGFRAYYSSVTLNSATATNPADGYFGGIRSVGTGSVYLYNSTIGGNQASQAVGGLTVQGQAKVKIVNSTISSNSATTGFIGGAYLQAQTIQISNSTIAANTANTTQANRPPGLAVVGVGSSPTFVMQSSIVAGNLYGATPTTDNDLSSNIVITGSNNLVQVSNASLPGDTIVGKCAFLGPLKDNGGLTQTQALLGHSPALDSGNNTFGASFDQRGKIAVNGDQNYPRVLGPTGTTPRADIGAYEVNRVDEIYDADFDSC